MKKLPSMSEFFLQNAPKLGAKILIDPNFGYAGRIEFPNGNVRFFKYNHIDINTVGSSEIAKDKDYAAFFLKELGYSTIPGQTFFSDEWARDIGSDQTKQKAIEYAEMIGFPVFVKPNSSGLGYGVAQVGNVDELSRALDEAYIYDRVVLVQKPVIGMSDYRIVVFAGEVVCAYRKIPLTIIGDGEKTVAELFEQKKKSLGEVGRSASIELSDYRIQNTLKHLGWNTDSVVEKDAAVQLLQNANMSQGGDGFDETDEISDAWEKWATDLSKKMNLTLCGIDVLVERDLSGEVGDYAILEINNSPGLNHYRTLSEESEKRTQKFYHDMLQYLAQ